MDKRIFLSYCHDDIEDVNYIDNIFLRFNIYLTRDIRDLKYNTNVHNFMDKINEYDRIIIYVSDSYLQSINCLYEASHIFDIKDRVVFILKDNTDIFSLEGKERFILYWKLKYEKSLNKDPVVFKNEIEDIRRAYHTIGRFIDLIKKEYIMKKSSLDFNNLLDTLNLNRTYPEIITKVVFDWIARYPKARLSPIIALINDLYNSTVIVLSEFPDIPDNEIPYLFKNITFLSNINGIDLSIEVQNLDTGENKNIRFSRLVEVNENSRRSNHHSRFYFLCENPSKKQQFFETEKISKTSTRTTKEQCTINMDYLDTYRITIRFSQ